MSALSTVSTSSSAQLYQLLQELQQSSKSSQTNGVSGSTTQGTGSDPMDQFWDTELESQGFSGTALSDLRAKIESAAETAKSSSSDPEAVKTAVQQVLKDAGVDVDKVDADMATQRAKGGGGPGGAGGMGGAGGPPPMPPTEQSEGTDSDSDDASSSSASTSTKKTLAEQLASLGIDSSSFLQALQAFLSSDNKTADISSLFTNIPTGTQVNLTA